MPWSVRIWRAAYWLISVSLKVSETAVSAAWAGAAPAEPRASMETAPARAPMLLALWNEAIIWSGAYYPPRLNPRPCDEVR